MNYSEMIPMPGLKLDRADYKTNLAYIRNDRRITQAALAERSGVKLRMLQKYEIGEKDINVAAALTVYKLAEALGCEVKDLLETDAPSEN